MGRYVVVSIDPSDRTILGGPYAWIGFPAGAGIWTTVDGGTSWVCQQTQEVHVAVSPWLPPDGINLMAESDALADGYRHEPPPPECAP